MGAKGVYQVTQKATQMAYGDKSTWSSQLQNLEQRHPERPLQVEVCVPGARLHVYLTDFTDPQLSPVPRSRKDLPPGSQGSRKWLVLHKNSNPELSNFRAVGFQSSFLF